MERIEGSLLNPFLAAVKLLIIENFHVVK